MIKVTTVIVRIQKQNAKTKKTTPIVGDAIVNDIGKVGY